MAANKAFTYYLSASNFTWIDANGQLTLATIENVRGTNQADSLSGNTSINVLEGGAGNDVLIGKSGNDTLIGGVGNDTYLVDNTVGYTLTEATDAGTDTIQASVNYSLVGLANIENLTLIGTATTGTGDAFDNVLIGNSVSNILTGGVGNDTLDGGVSDVYNLGVTDMLNGEAGNDTFLSRGFYGAGTYNGGVDTDVLDFSQSDAYTAGRRNMEGAGVKVDLLAGKASTYYLRASNFTWADANGQITLTGIENVRGTTQSDLITGDANANVLDGGASDNYNPSVTDVLNGGAGNDTFLSRGFYGAGNYTGGTETDWLDFSQSDAYTAGRRNAEGAGVKVDLVAGKAFTYYLQASGFTWADANGQLTLATIENVRGTNQADSLSGDANANVLEGGNGADTLVGGRGQDNYTLTETTAATDTVRIATGDSLVGSYDKATGFGLGTGTISTAGVDKLDLANTLIATNAAAVDGVNSGTIMSHSINNGIISFDGVNNYTSPLTVTAATNLADVFSYLQTNITGGNTVAFVAEGNTFVFQDAGVTDTLVELVGVSANSVNTTGLGVGSVWIA